MISKGFSLICLSINTQPRIKQHITSDQQKKNTFSPNDNFIQNSLCILIVYKKFPYLIIIQYLK